MTSSLPSATSKETSTKTTTKTASKSSPKGNHLTPLEKARKVRSENVKEEHKRDATVIKEWRSWLDEEAELYRASIKTPVGSPERMQWMAWRKENPMPNLTRLEVALKRNPNLRSVNEHTGQS